MYVLLNSMDYMILKSIVCQTRTCSYVIYKHYPILLKLQIKQMHFLSLSLSVICFKARKRIAVK